MNKKTITWVMYLLMGLGSSLVVLGVGLVFFTDIYVTKGANGVMLIATLIAGGFFLILPSKIYLTIILMQESDTKKVRESLSQNS